MYIMYMHIPGKLKDPPSSSKDEEEAKEVEEENEQPTSIVTKEAEDPKQEKSGANIRGVCGL